MTDMTEELEVLKNYGISPEEDFEQGECEICHEKNPVTSVILTFMLQVPFEKLSKADQRELTKSAKEKGEDIPEEIEIPMNPLLSSEFCATCLAQGLWASHVQLNIVNPKGVMASPVKTYYSEDSITESS